jgi:hypothetical protein
VSGQLCPCEAPSVGPCRAEAHPAKIVGLAVIEGETALGNVPLEIVGRDADLSALMPRLRLLQ